MSADLLDRADQLAALERTVGALAAGTPSLVEIRGGSGTGRTALLTRAVESARASGAVPLTVTGVSLSGAGDHSVVGTLMARLAHPEPANGGWTPAEAGAAVLDLARTTRVLLAVDDADRLDPSSRTWLARLGERAGRRALTIMTVTGTAQHVLDEATVLTTGSLPPSAVAELAARRLGEQANGIEVDLLHRCTGGVPAVLHAVLDALRGRVPCTGEEIAELAADAFGDVVTRAVVTLPAEASRLLQSLALCGPHVPFDLTCAVAGLRTLEAGRALDLLAGTGLVTRQPPALVDGISADRVLAAMTRSARDELHCRAARLAHRDAVEVSDVVRILAATPPLGEPWVVPVLRIAAQCAVERGEPRLAVEHLERALREPADPRSKAQLLLDLALAEGRYAPEVADRRLARMLLERQPPECEQVRLAAADQLFARGDTALIRRTFAAAPSSTVVERNSLAAMYWMVSDAPLELPEFSLLGVAPPPFSADDPACAGTAAWLCLAQSGDVAVATRLARLAVAAPAASLVQRMVACAVLAFADQSAEAISAVDLVLTEARTRGLGAVESHALATRALLMLRSGRLAEAGAALEAARRAVTQRHWRPDARLLMFTVDIQLSMEGGELDRAVELVEGLPQDEIGHGYLHVLLLFVRAMVALRCGDVDKALTLAEEYGRRALARRWSNPALSMWRSVAAKALHVRGDIDSAARLCAEEIDLARAWGVPSVLGLAHLSRATVFGGADDLNEAVRLLRNSPCRLVYATALLELAERTATPDRAALVREAAEIAVLHQAGGLLDQVRRLGWVPGA